MYIKLLLLRSYYFPFPKSYIIHTGKNLHQLIRNWESQAWCTVGYIHQHQSKGFDTANRVKGKKKKQTKNHKPKPNQNQQRSSKRTLALQCLTQPIFWQPGVPCNALGECGMTEIWGLQLFAYLGHQDTKPPSNMGKRQSIEYRLDIRHLTWTHCRFIFFPTSQS